jgi:hypothetical protein
MSTQKGDAYTISCACDLESQSETQDIVSRTIQVRPRWVTAHGSTAAIVLAVLADGAEGAPVMVSKTGLGRASGLHRVAVGRALDRLQRDGAIKVDKTRRLNRLVIRVTSSSLDCHDPIPVTRRNSDVGVSGVEARLASIRSLLDAIG